MLFKRSNIPWLLFFLFISVNSYCQQQQTVLLKLNNLSKDSALALQLKTAGLVSNSLKVQPVNGDIFNYSRLNAYNSEYTFQFQITNTSAINKPLLFIEYRNFRAIALYRLVNGQWLQVNSEKEKETFSGLFVTDPDYVYNLQLARDSTAVYELRLTTFNPVNLSARVCAPDWFNGESDLKIFISAIYIGVMFATFFYNLFIFFSLRDKSYLYYCLYILFLGIAQLFSLGYGISYFVTNHSFFDHYSVNIFTSISFISGLLFALYFLQLRMYAKKTVGLILGILCSYTLVFILSFFDLNKICFALLNINALLTCFSLLIISAYVIRKGHTAAVYYLVAYVVLLIGLITYVLKNYGIIKPSWFVNNVIIIGSALEAILLSIALANRINILRKEKEMSQAEALQVAAENERLVRDQNIILEKNVAQRTEELINTNHQLNGALVSLKDAQAQLVDAEKMASLGQLTAGIAHEINNPINFVKSNINPLKLDIKDIFDVIKEYNHLHELSGDVSIYKKELKQIAELQQQLDIDFIKNEVQHLIKGIEDGAERTAEIVRGLRTFSRLDESELKIANVHEGIDSTIVLIRNTIPFDVRIVKHFNAAGNIECYPGKLNQVFMNIITNGLQAISAKHNRTDAESIIITTRDIDKTWMDISIKDTGIGMTEEVKHRVFEPFFTTKDVGEGTGLGMAIVFKIIEKHHGRIDINSSPGNGAEFIITLPYVQPIT